MSLDFGRELSPASPALPEDGLSVDDLEPSSPAVFRTGAGVGISEPASPDG